MTSAHFDFADLLLAAEKIGPSWLARLLQRHREQKRKAILKRRLKIN